MPARWPARCRGAAPPPSPAPPCHPRRPCPVLSLSSPPGLEPLEIGRERGPPEEQDDARDRQHTAGEQHRRGQPDAIGREPDQGRRRRVPPQAHHHRAAPPAPPPHARRPHVPPPPPT